MRRHISRVLGGVVAACGLGLAAMPSPALADASASFTIGPVRAAHGWSATIIAQCGRDANVTVDYSKGPADDALDHIYGGFPKPSVCSRSRSLGAGALSLSEPGLAAISVRLGSPGRLQRLAQPSGCRGGRSVYRTLVARGRIVLTIHTPAFGRVSLRSARALATSQSAIRCRQPRGGILLSASFGGQHDIFLTASRAGRGPGTVSLSVPSGDTLAGGVSGFTELEAFGGSSLFSARANLTRSVVHLRGLVSGTLTFTAQPACAGERNARPGTLGGQLTIHDPILGTVRLIGSQAAEIYMTKDGAKQPTCGAAALPPTVSFSDSCSSPGQCSVSGATNTVYFGDGTLPGTAPITGESWSFGDGSPPYQTGYPGLNVSHTYAAPGTYTVTLTVTTAGGGSYSSTGTVYIGS
ncbi:MAG TPA: PKD domain-containing protein [Solirubrobacteraceae bacterium]|nr:PKD domain-containing protein [Solirubrobacteraceae bacterium]